MSSLMFYDEERTNYRDGQGIQLYAFHAALPHEAHVFRAGVITVEERALPSTERWHIYTGKRGLVEREYICQDGPE